MGLKEIIANKKLKGKLDDLYLDVQDSFVDVTDRVNRNKLTKDAGAGILEATYDSGTERYGKLKESNPNSTDIFVENDKRFNVLFKSIQLHIENYNNDLTV